MDILGFLRGNKTIMIAVGLIVYLGTQMINGTEADPNVVNGLLAGGLWTLRLGMKNGTSPK